MYTLKNIREKVTKLELEKTQLQAELEELKEQAQTKIDNLQKENNNYATK